VTPYQLPDDTPQVANFSEETGLKEGTLYTTGVTDSFYDLAANTIEMLPVFVFMIAREQAVTLDDAQSEYAWRDVDIALAQLTFAGHKTALEVIRRDFILREPDPLKRIDQSHIPPSSRH
jgi:dATP pyrophosphohydrolase